MSLALALVLLLMIPQWLGCSSVSMTMGPGSDHTCATDDRVASCWGSDVEGRLGDGTAGGHRETPMPVTGLGPRRRLDRRDSP